MGSAKLNLEAESAAELMQDLITALEEMGVVVVKSNGEMPKEIYDILKNKGEIVYTPGEGIPDGLLSSLYQENEQDLIDFLLEKKSALEKIVASLEEQGYEIHHPHNGDKWE
ncbi:MAG: hypothetical protein HUU50_22565 [Candidatus Brocadiae bacterium]|nr:hypothetical protein [Candidatus Brocadiia bacterium]